MDKNADDRQVAGSDSKVERLLKMLQSDPGNSALRRQCIETAVSSGRYDVVLELADAALAKDPADASALFDKATVAIGRREFRAALEFLQRVKEIAGPASGIQMNIGLCHYCLGEFDLARPHLEECYQAGTLDSGLLRLLISSYHHLGLMDEAVEIAKSHEEAGKSDAALAGIYALLFLDTNDVARAAKWARIALQLNPKSVDGRVTEATLLTARMQTERAKDMLEDVLQDAPETGRAWLGLGALYLLAQQLEDAKKHLTRGVELIPRHVGSWHVLAWAQLLSRDLDGAEASFQHALQLDRNFAETHGGLAAIAALRGERQSAQHLAEVALRLDGECLSAKFAQSVLAGQAGNPAQSQKILLDTVAGLSSKDSSALSKLLTKGTRH